MSNAIHIIGLEAENFKRLKAVSLNLNGNHLILGGDNEQGKSSVLDAIWVALGGADVMKDLKISRPIRKGAEKAMVKLDLGNLIVTRKWTSDDKSYLEVSTKEGAVFKSPQGMLDALMGRLFDPFEFSRMKESDQREILLKLVNIDLDLAKWAVDRKSVFEQRTDINREVTRLENTLKGKPDVDAPSEEVSSAAIFEEMQAAQLQKDDNEKQRQELRQFAASYREELGELQLLKDRHDEIETEIARLQEEKAGVISKAEEQSKLIDRMEKQGTEKKLAVEALVDPDMTTFQSRLAEVEETNAKVRAKKDRAQIIHDLNNEKTKSQALTQQLADLDEQKATATKAAAFPIDGLGFDDSGVTFNGIPFGQCSSEERIRVGMAIAMAASPTLKVIRIADGSLLDVKNLQLIQEMAAGQGYQLLIEKVGDPGEMGVIIEDGEVKAAEQVAA